MSYFTKEALEKFQEMCADGIDFSEGDEYDFVQCIDSKGDIYGVEPGEACKSGRKISDAAAAKIRQKGKKGEKSSARMAKLRAAFRKKTGREMNEEEKAKAAWIANGKKK